MTTRGMRGGIGGVLAVALLAAATGAGAGTIEFGTVTKLEQTWIVAPIGTATENGDLLRSTLASIPATSGSPYLLKLEPGVYDVGATALDMVPYVDIEGSGTGTTTINGTAGCVIQAVSNAELRSLTVRNSSNSSGVAIYGVCIETASPSFKDIDIVSRGFGGPTIRGGVYAGPGAEPTFVSTVVDVHCSSGSGCQTVRGFHVVGDGGNPPMLTLARTNVWATGSSAGAGTFQGVYASGGNGTIILIEARESTFNGTDTGFFIETALPYVNLANSQVMNGHNGGLTCAYCYDANFGVLDASCN